MNTLPFFPPPRTAPIPSSPMTPPLRLKELEEQPTRLQCRKIGILSDLELHLTYKHVGMRQEEDSRCFNCLAEQDHQHRLKWTECRDTCPACPPDRQHNGSFCPRLCTLRKQGSFWKTRLLESPEPRERSCGEHQQEQDISRPEPRLSNMTDGAGKRSTNSPTPQTGSGIPSSRPQRSQPPGPSRTRPRVHTPPRSPRQSSFYWRRHQSRSIPLEPVGLRYRNRAEPRSRHTDTVSKGAPPLSKLLEDPSARDQILSEAVRLFNVLKRHPTIDNILLDILRLSDTVQQQPRGYIHYTPSDDVARYVEHMKKHFPRLISRGPSASRMGSSSFHFTHPLCNGPRMGNPPGPSQTSPRSKETTRLSYDGSTRDFWTRAPPPGYVDFDRVDSGTISHEGLHYDDQNRAEQSNVFGDGVTDVGRSAGESRENVAIASLDVVELTEEDWEDLFKGDV